MLQWPRADETKCSSMKDNPTQPRMISFQRPVYSFGEILRLVKWNNVYEWLVGLAPAPFHTPRPLVPSSFSLPSPL